MEVVTVVLCYGLIRLRRALVLSMSSSLIAVVAAVTFKIRSCLMAIGP